MHFEARIATNPIEANIHHTLRGEKTPDSIHTHTRQAITPHKTSQHEPQQPPTHHAPHPRLPPRPPHKHRHPLPEPRGPLNTAPLNPLRNHLDRLPVTTPHHRCRAMGLPALPGWLGLVHYRQGFSPEIPQNLSSQGPAGGEQSPGAEERAVGRGEGLGLGGEVMGGWSGPSSGRLTAMSS